MSKCDILFINPGNHQEIYQKLSGRYSAVEPPTWLLLLAQSCRAVGNRVEVLDACAEHMPVEEAVLCIKKKDPRLVCFVAYGQNPNSGAVSMSGVVKLASAIKEAGLHIPVSVVGTYVQALPLKTLEDEPSIDIVFTNEGVYAIRNILKVDIHDEVSLSKVKGIGFRSHGRPVLTSPEVTVPQEMMDIDLPGYAWDLLPYDKRPLDIYRSPFWHAEYIEEKRSPYAAIYTSLGCPFRCSFCGINMINRSDNDPIGVASNYSQMRFWSPEFIIKEFDKLFEMGVRTLRISDEMFLLNQKYYLPLCKLLIERGYGKDLNMWAYSRIDTARNTENLKLIRKAGIKWLCLGIESGSKNVRLQATKGHFEDVDIRDVVKMIHDTDIEIIGNYLFGLAGDTHETMQSTFDLSIELCTMAWNAYAVMALPGSQIYKEALEKGFDLPKDYAEYSFHSYNTKPLPTEHLSPAEILKFRDESWLRYHNHLPFLQKVEKKYGKMARESNEKMTKIRLKRKLLGD